MNKQLPRHLACLALCIAATGVNATQSAANTPKSTDRVLKAMDNTPTEGHPDQFYEFTGMHQYFAGNYADALKSFTNSARYADKLSQLSIGLMYLNGQGVQRDPVTAFAWVAIAAERKYPQFLATRDQIWAQLDAQQRDQAKALIDKLYPEYGDATAKPRMAMVLRRERAHLTGSYLGFGSDSVSSQTPSQLLGPSAGGGPPPACGGDTIDGAAMTGCGNIYASWRWDPKQYFAARDGAWFGTVSVGALQDVKSATPTPKSEDKQKDTQ